MPGSRQTRRRTRCWVFMAWKPLDRSVELPPQTLAAPVRTGFTLVEWGGAEIS